MGHSPPLRHLNHLVDDTRHRFANPAAAVVPALASTFDSWVTSVECVTTRCALVCVGLPAHHTFLVAAATRFPPTKTEARGIAPGRIFPVWHRLPSISLVSPPLLIRLGLAPLSFLPAEFLARSPTESPVDRSCRHAVAPGTSRVKGTQACSLSPGPADGIYTRFESRAIETGTLAQRASHRCSLVGY